MATDIPTRIRQLVDERDGKRCVRCGTGSNLQKHHRRRRGMGGTRNPAIHGPANLITLCGLGNTSGCHGWVETHRTEALALGYLLERLEDAVTTPVQCPDGTWLLTEDGARVPDGIREAS